MQGSKPATTTKTIQGWAEQLVVKAHDRAEKKLGVGAYDKDAVDLDDPEGQFAQENPGYADELRRDAGRRGGLDRHAEDWRGTLPNQPPTEKRAEQVEAANRRRGIDRAGRMDSGKADRLLGFVVQAMDDKDHASARKTLDNYGHHHSTTGEAGSPEAMGAVLNHPSAERSLGSMLWQFKKHAATVGNSLDRHAFSSRDESDEDSAFDFFENGPKPTMKDVMPQSQLDRHSVEDRWSPGTTKGDVRRWMKERGYHQDHINSVQGPDDEPVHSKGDDDDGPNFDAEGHRRTVAAAEARWNRNAITDSIRDRHAFSSRDESDEDTAFDFFEDEAEEDRNRRKREQQKVQQRTDPTATASMKSKYNVAPEGLEHVVDRLQGVVSDPYAVAWEMYEAERTDHHGLEEFDHLPGCYVRNSEILDGIAKGRYKASHAVIQRAASDALEDVQRSFEEGDPVAKFWRYLIEQTRDEAISVADRYNVSVWDTTPRIAMEDIQRHAFDFDRAANRAGKQFQRDVSNVRRDFSGAKVREIERKNPLGESEDFRQSRRDDFDSTPKETTRPWGRTKKERHAMDNTDNEFFDRLSAIDDVIERHGISKQRRREAKSNEPKLKDGWDNPVSFESPKMEGGQSPSDSSYRVGHDKPDWQKSDQVWVHPSADERRRNFLRTQVAGKGNSNVDKLKGPKLARAAMTAGALQTGRAPSSVRAGIDNRMKKMGA